MSEIEELRDEIQPPDQHQPAEENQTPDEHQPPDLPWTGFLRARQIHSFFGIGLSTWWLWVKQGRAPPGIRLGKRTTVWRAEDIRALLNELAQES